MNRRLKELRALERKVFGRGRHAEAHEYAERLWRIEAARRQASSKRRRGGG